MQYFISLLLAVSLCLAVDREAEFKRNDRNRDGKLSKGEFNRGNVGDENDFREADKNKDGFISLSEYCDWLGK